MDDVDDISEATQLLDQSLADDVIERQEEPKRRNKLRVQLPDAGPRSFRELEYIPPRDRINVVMAGVTADEDIRVRNALHKLERLQAAFPEKKLVVPNSHRMTPEQAEGLLHAAVNDCNDGANPLGCEHVLLMLATMLEKLTPKMEGLTNAWMSVIGTHQSAVKITNAIYFPSVNPIIGLAAALAATAGGVLHENTQKANALTSSVRPVPPPASGSGVRPPSPPSRRPSPAEEKWGPLTEVNPETDDDSPDFGDL